uniref:Transmembrane protein n=1 Tax=Medicago truncatula TaxID=3880 RepID=I3TAH8_MEDTR|nr:unknown [Medicago truncatula]
MLVEIAITLVTTANIIITSAIILSCLVDMPRASLKTIVPGKTKARDRAVVDPKN